MTPRPTDPPPRARACTNTPTDESHPMETTTTPPVPPLEETASDLAQRMLQLAMQLAARNFGDAHAHAAIDAIASGRALLVTLVQVDHKEARVTARIEPLDESIAPAVIADIGILRRPATSH